ncbi:MAG TPA: OsmC family protein [Gemmataceae bacterium]|jgi:putative redox protein
MIQATSLATPFQTSFTNGSHEAVADIPIEKGGAGSGFGPHELLEAALATCIAMTVRMSAAKHGIPLAGVQCEVRIDRTTPDSVILNYALEFDGPLSEEQAAKLRGAANRCPVARTLTGAISLQQSQSVQK